MLTILNLVCFKCQENASALAIGLRLYYKTFILVILLAFLYFLPKFWKLRRQKPSLRKKPIVFRKLLCHFRKTHPQQILPSQYINARKMANLLKKMHFDQSIRLDHMINPQHIPIPLLTTVLDPPFQFLGNIGDHIIMGHC